ncbi:hypothetical protein [Labrenzia sp. 011]|uniref:hypothetical protein n=1 Tax=Labrenzia sp. 011 TaxID=2171494 RepID=UPI00140224B4|nr:hypothetical protein [Labrenzia sp. 011]
MTRLVTASIAVLGIAVLVALDASATPPNPYKAPPLLALGSGTAPSGGFCGALPEPAGT